MEDIQGSTHILLAYNVYLGVMDYFKDKETLTKDKFMDLNQMIWKSIKEELNLNEVILK